MIDSILNSIDNFVNYVFVGGTFLYALIFLIFGFGIVFEMYKKWKHENRY